jgi:phosphohistidine phosphatase SixA
VIAVARRLLTLLLPLLFIVAPSAVADSEWALLDQPGAIVLFRHGSAPGSGDPAGFTLGDCATQRNLNDQGRAEARAIGEAFRSRGVAVGRVLSSQWCRALDTARLAFPGRVQPDSAFNSFFADSSARPQTTARALATLADWAGPGVLVAVTHQVNITALTGVTPSEGAGVIVRMQAGVPTVMGILPPPAVG